MIKKRLGFLRRYYCDRCGKKIDYYIFHFCQNCFSIPPTIIRRFEVKNEKSRKVGSVFCSLCNIDLIEDNSHQVCLSCSSGHPDNTHYDWSYRIPPDHIKIEPNGLTWANHCFRCGSVQVVRRNQDLSLEFFYFKKGNKYPKRKPFTCLECDLNDLDAGRAEMKNCIHDWIVVAENVTEADLARQIYNGLKNNPVRDLMGWDEAEILHISYGEKSNWCWKCGCFYITSPGRKQPLPEKGLWY